MVSDLRKGSILLESVERDWSAGAVTYMVAGEGLAFNDDLPAVCGWAIEGRHQKMQVRSQRLHDDNFAWKRADDLGGLLLGRIVEVQPWWQASLVVCEVTKDPFRRPGIQIPVHIVSRSAWLQTERIAAEIYRLLIIAVLRR